MKQMVSYKLKPDRVAENEALVLAVFKALIRAKPAALSYATFRQPDGVSFIHLVSYTQPDGRYALTSLPEFKAFAQGIEDRCEAPPVRVELTEIGSYGVFDGS